MIPMSISHCLFTAGVKAVPNRMAWWRFEKPLTS
jgi:hypothetical protein